MKDLGMPVSTQTAFLYLFGDGWKPFLGKGAPSA